MFVYIMKSYANFIWLLLTIKNIVCSQIWKNGSTTQTSFSVSTVHYRINQALTELKNLSDLSTMGNVIENVNKNLVPANTVITNAQLMNGNCTNVKISSLEETEGVNESDNQESILKKIRFYFKKKKVNFNTTTVEKSASNSKTEPTLISYNSTSYNNSNYKHTTSSNSRSIDSSIELRNTQFTVILSSLSYKNNSLSTFTDTYAPVTTVNSSTEMNSTANFTTVTTEINYKSIYLNNQSIQMIKHDINDSDALINRAHLGTIEEIFKSRQQPNENNVLNNVHTTDDVKCPYPEVLQRNLTNLRSRIKRYFRDSTIAQNMKTTYINAVRNKPVLHNRNVLFDIKESMELVNMKRTTECYNRVHRAIKPGNHKGVNHQRISEGTKLVNLKLLMPNSEPFPNLFNELPGSIFRSHFMRNLSENIKNIKVETIEIELT